MDAAAGGGGGSGGGGGGGGGAGLNGCAAEVWRRCEGGGKCCLYSLILWSPLKQLVQTAWNQARTRFLHRVLR